MRIIGGQWRGRRIQIPSKGWPVRPTTDFAREALFNMLDNRLDYETVAALDLFGGTGIHCMELASRGCLDITYVDRYRDSVKFMRTFVKEWNVPIEVVLSDVEKFVKQATRKWDYIFADPPYDMRGLESFPTMLLEADVLSPEGFFVLEHISTKSFDKTPGFREARHYGQSVFSFFGAGS